MAGFVQIVEFRASRIDSQVQDLIDERQPQMEDGSTVRRLIATADRDRPGYYLTIIEFDSYEAAMENSNRPGDQRGFRCHGASCVMAHRSFTTWTSGRPGSRRPVVVRVEM